MSFLPEGQTRRQISFDFDFPRGQEIWWDSAKVKLTAKRPPTGSSGVSQLAVPLTYMQKGSLTEFDLRDAGELSLPSLGKADNGYFELCALMYLAEQLGLDVSEDSAVYEGTYCLIHGIVDRKTFAVGDCPSSRDELRQVRVKDLIESLDTGTPCAKWEEALSAGDTFGAYVGEMFAQLRERVNAIRPPLLEQGTTTKEQRYLLAFLTLLYAAVDSFVLIALVPSEGAVGRTIVKARFNSTGKKRSQPWTKHLFSWPTTYTQRILFSGVNASTSHLEILAPIEAELDRPVVCFKCKQRQSEQRGSRASHLPVCPANDVSVTETQARTHLTINKYSFRPIVSVDVRLRIPSILLLSALAWVVFTILITGACGLIVYFQTDVIHKFFTADNVFAFITILLAVWIAARFTVGRHPVTKELYWPLNRALVTGTLFAVLVLLSVALITLENGKFVSQSERHPSWFVAVSIAALGSIWLIYEVIGILNALVKGFFKPKHIRSDREMSAGDHLRDHAEVATLSGVADSSRCVDLVKNILSAGTDTLR